LKLIGALDELPQAIELHSALACSFREQGDVEKYTILNQASCLLKKLEYSFKPFVEVSCETAQSKWLLAEKKCRTMNGVYWEIIQKPLTHGHDDLAQLLTSMRKDIQILLGEECPDLCDVVGWMKFGPGSDSTHCFAEGSVPYKLDASIPHSYYRGMEDEVRWVVENSMVSYCAFGHRNSLDEAFAFRGDVGDPLEGLVPVESAKLTLVPKSIAEKRVIEVGPSIAGFIQQGYDGFIRQRLLKKWGLDLNDQEPNRRLAYLGSLDEGLRSPCTIDLSSASDMVSFGVVASLLPPQWVRTLARFRAKSVETDWEDSPIVLEKFSAMGNAYTFSLQTLIFAAVVRSVLRDRGHEGMRWRCYGDDIIVPKCIYEDVLNRLAMLGFEVNKTKSFADFGFRESCGADFMLGTYVRGVYLKKPIETVADLFKYVNLLNVAACELPVPAMCYEGVISLLLSWVPKKFRLFGNVRTCDLAEAAWSPSITGAHKIIRAQQRSRPIKNDSWRYMVALYSGYTPPPILEAGGNTDVVVAPRGAIHYSYGKAPGWGRRCYKHRQVAFDPLFLINR
jgi:hypothetical protein